MKNLAISVVCACCTLIAPASFADLDRDHNAQIQPDSSKPVNAMCPVGNEPVEANGGRYEYKGNTIGFCCPGCIEKFAAWDEAKKDEFMAMSMMNPHPENNLMYTCPMHPSESHADKNAKCSICSMNLVPAAESKGETMHADSDASSVRVGDPYLLNTCPISGEELGGMGDPIVKLYNGREVKFCCMMCVPKFEKDLKASFANLDAQIIESQIAFYPTTNCIVSGEALGGEEMGDPINFVYNNRLIRFCCKMCKGDFKKDPQTYIKKLDAAVIAQQGEHYPMTTCLISGEDLEGESINIVYGGRLVKFCCEKCVEKFEADPMPTIEKVDAAWMAMHSDRDDSGHNDG